MMHNHCVVFHLLANYFSQENRRRNLSWTIFFCLRKLLSATLVNPVHLEHFVSFLNLFQGGPDHCHYQGSIRGLADSTVVLNTCSGLRY